MTTDSIPVVSTEDTPDAGQQLLDQLGLDAQPIQPSDQHLYGLGCLVSALALHVPAGLWTRVGLYDHPAQGPEVETDDLPDLEVLARDDAAAAEIVAALPWKPGAPITRRETWAESGRVHVVTRGVLWGSRISVVGLEPAGGAS